MELKIFEPHSIKQQNAIMSNTKITLLITGIQFGKTTAGALWMKRLMFQRGAGNYIITAPTYKIMQQSTLPAFLAQMEGCGDYRKADSFIEMANGAKCFLRTATEIDSVVGITNVNGIWGDEAGKYSLYFWENIQARSSFKQCPILLTTTPYTTNWVYKELLRPWKQGKRTEDLMVIQGSSQENKYFPKEEFELKRKTMEPARFSALYLGEFDKMHGTVYDCFNEDIHVTEPFQFPFGTKFYGGIDWGYTHPFVMLIRAITPSGHHFQISETYKTRLTLNDMVSLARQVKQIFDIERFYADPSQPGFIEEFNRNGLPCVPADNDIRRGIDLHYELMKLEKFKIFKGTSPHTIDEMEMYHYPEPDEVLPDQDNKEHLPVKQNDDCMDAMRYLTTALYRSEHKRKPSVPEEAKKLDSLTAPDVRIKERRKIHHRHPGSEKWSE